jgi:AAA ATPase central domain protein|nr:MAG TPA: ATPase [Caudoviricetes sp.]
MAENSEFNDILVQISRLALKGAKEDLRLYLSRIVNSNIKKSKNHVWLSIRNLLQDFPVEASSTRSFHERVIPIDSENLNLLQEEPYPIRMNIEPIWEGKTNIELNQFINECKKKDVLLNNGLNFAQKLLFSGPPGVGKTLAAKWIANKLNLPLYTLSLSSIMSSFLGKTGNNIKSVFDFARTRKCVLFFDEFDSIAKRRNDDTELGELKRLVTVLLQEIDKWEGPSFFVAATNHGELLDPAVWRRFDITIEFRNPSKRAIEEAIKVYFGESQIYNDKILSILVTAMQGMSYSEIERAILTFRKTALLENKKLINIIIDWITNSKLSLDKDEMLTFAKELFSCKISQRLISEITGISRDTLRKKIKE